MRDKPKLSATREQTARLASLKADQSHLWAPKGLMIDDPDLVARIAALAERLNMSKRELVKHSVQLEFERLEGAA